MKRFQKLLAHAMLILSLLLLTLFVVDRFNRAMMFLSNELTKWLVAVFALLAAVQAVLLIAGFYRKK